MSATRTALYLDTCAIIEAHRTGCWRHLAGNFELHTVKGCWDELRDGNPRDPGYVPVDTGRLAAEVVVHEIGSAHRVAARLKSAKVGDLDLGERDLLAWCVSQAPTAMILTTGDRAAIVAACELGLKDCLQSLEEITAGCGVSPKLQNHYRRNWLAEIRTKWALDNL